MQAKKGSNLRKGVAAFKRKLVRTKYRFGLVAKKGSACKPTVCPLE